MALLWFLLRFLSFISSVTSHLFPGLLRAIRRERVHTMGVPKMYPLSGCLQVWTPAACVTGKCFIHYSPKKKSSKIFTIDGGQVNSRTSLWLRWFCSMLYNFLCKKDQQSRFLTKIVNAPNAAKSTKILSFFSLLHFCSVKLHFQRLESQQKIVRCSCEASSQWLVEFTFNGCSCFSELFEHDFR